jgi:hypothetical protein
MHRVIFPRTVLLLWQSVTSFFESSKNLDGFQVDYQKLKLPGQHPFFMEFSE